jgi:phage FluMu protein Com
MTVLHRRRPCCGKPARLAPVPGERRYRCPRCRVVWRVRVAPAHEHTREIVGGDDLLVARWEREG